MKLTLVLGPMFAGKTSFLIEKYKQAKNENKSMIAIKPKIDNRYQPNQISSHNNIHIPALVVNNLDEIEINSINNFDIILIDEGQFFENLNLWIRNLEDFYGEIIISALNGDFKRKNFGEISLLISRADDIIFLQGQCHFCHRPSSFSKKLSPSENQVEVGGADKYVPVCGNCYQIHF